MNNKKKYLVSAVLELISALCFGIAAYGNFYNSKSSLGLLNLTAAILMLFSCILCYKNYKK